MTEALQSRPGSDLAAASALRGMTIGCIGLLFGGVFVLCAAYGLGGPVSSEAGLERYVGLVLGGAITVLGGISFVRGLVTREELHRGADGVSIVLVTLVTVPLAALGLGGYSHTHPPDKQVRGQPYTFSYPGNWKPNPHMDSVATQQGVGYVTALGARATPDPGQGVLVVAFIPDSKAVLEDWVRTPTDTSRVIDERTIDLGGRSAIMVDYERLSGKPYQSQAAVMYGEVAYVVTCFVELRPEEAREGCQKVLDTFRFTS